MASRTEQLLAQNAHYVKTHKPIPKYPDDAAILKSVKGTLIISCLDQRIIPEEFFGLSRGEVPVIRNAGGRAKGAVFDVAVLDTLITLNEIIIIHHTDCGLTHTTDNLVRESLVRRSEEEAAKIDIDGFTFTNADILKSVRDDVAFLKQHPFVQDNTKVTGFVFEIETGKLKPVDA